jgi:hypothetical protein
MEKKKGYRYYLELIALKAVTELKVTSVSTSALVPNLYKALRTHLLKNQRKIGRKIEILRSRLTRLLKRFANL